MDGWCHDGAQQISPFSNKTWYILLYSLNSYCCYLVIPETSSRICCHFPFFSSSLSPLSTWMNEAYSCKKEIKMNEWSLPFNSITFCRNLLQCVWAFSIGWLHLFLCSWKNCSSGKYFFFLANGIRSFLVRACFFAIKWMLGCAWDSPDERIWPHLVNVCLFLLQYRHSIHVKLWMCSFSIKKNWTKCR